MIKNKEAEVLPPHLPPQIQPAQMDLEVKNLIKTIKREKETITPIMHHIELLLKCRVSVVIIAEVKEITPEDK